MATFELTDPASDLREWQEQQNAEGRVIAGKVETHQGLQGSNNHPVNGH